MIAAAVAGGVVAAIALAVGGACGVAHLVTLGRSVGAFLGRGADARRAHLAISYVLRLLVSIGVLVALIQMFDPIPLAIGFGLVLLATTVHVGRGGLLVPNPIEGA